MQFPSPEKVNSVYKETGDDFFPKPLPSAPFLGSGAFEH